MVSTDSFLAGSMKLQVFTTRTSAWSGWEVSSWPLATSWPIMTSLSTRFLGQPRLTKPIFKRISKPPECFLQDNIAGTGLMSRLPVAGCRAVHSTPTFVAHGSAAAYAGLARGGFAGVGVGAGGNVGQQVVVGENVLDLCQTLQIGGQFARAQGRAFLDADVVLQKQRQIGGDRIANCGNALFNAVKSIDADCLRLLKSHKP